MKIRLAGALVACVCASAFGASPVAAQGSYSPYDESPTAALGRSPALTAGTRVVTTQLANAMDGLRVRAAP